MADSSERVDILLKLATQLEGQGEALEFLKSFAVGITGVGLAFGAAELGAKFSELIKSSAELGSQIEIMAGRAEMSTEAFQTLWITSERYGVKQEDIIRGSTSLQRNLEVAAKNGASPMAKALEDLGLSAAGLQALAPERQFEVLGDRIANATDKHAAFAAAMDLLGTKSAPKLLEYLKALGVEGYDKLADSVAKIKLSDAQISTLDKGAFHLERMATAAKLLIAAGLVNTVEAFSAALPPIVAAQQKMIELEAKAPANGGGMFDTFTRGFNILELNHARAEFARLAIEQGGDGNLAAAGDAIKKMQSAGATGPAFKALQDSLAAAYKKQEELKVQHLATEKKMQEAALAAELTAMDKYHLQLTQKVSAFDQKSLDSAGAATRKAMEEQDKKLGELAESAKRAADPTYALEQKIFELGRAQQAGKLTAEEYEAQVAKLRFEFAGGFTPAIEEARAKLLEFQEAANEVTNNPFLSTTQKSQERVKLLKEENAEIDRQIKLLKEQIALHPGTDAKSPQHEIDSLGRKKIGNQKETGVFDPATAGVAANLGAEFTKLQSQIKAPAQNIASTITGTIGNAFRSVSQNVTGLIMGTQNWHDALRNVGQTIEGDLIGGIVKMFTEWVEQRAVAALASMAWSEAEGQTDTAAKAPGAILSSISSWGVAAAIGVAAVVAAMAAAGSFSVGGFTDNIGTNSVAGVVHGGEWVAPSWMVEHPAFGGVIGGLENARTGGAPSAASGNRPQRVVHVAAKSENHARQLLQDPDFHNELLRWHRGQFGF